MELNDSTAELRLRRQYEALRQEQADIQAQRRLLDQRERELVDQRFYIFEEIGKLVIARTEAGDGKARG